MPETRQSRCILIALVGCLSFTSCQRAEQPGNGIIIGETVTVSSRHLTKDMIIDVYLPNGYSGKSGRYPILATCQSHFMHVSGITADLKPRGLKWEYHPFLDEDHGSIANKVIYHGLKFIFSNWTSVPAEIAGQGVQAIRAYATGLNKTFGYDIGISKSAMWRVVHSYRDQRRAADVIDLLKLSLEYEPNAEMTWLELGRAYEANNELDQTKTALETAYKKAVQNSSPHLGIFTDAVDKIHRKLNPE